MTWRELEQRKRPTPGVVVGTLMEYVDSGSAIDPRIVFDVVKRAAMSPTELWVVCKWLLSGEILQSKRGEGKSRDQYFKCRMMVLAYRVDLIRNN